MLNLFLLASLVQYSLLFIRLRPNLISNFSFSLRVLFLSSKEIYIILRLKWLRFISAVEIGFNHGLQRTGSSTDCSEETDPIC